MGTLSVTLKAATGQGEATHKMHGPGTLWRKGPSGFAELHCGHGHWVGTDWENDQLDTCYLFGRLDGTVAPAKRSSLLDLGCSDELDEPDTFD